MTTTRIIAAAAVALAAGGASAQDFDACEVFTQDVARKAIGGPVEPEPVNPKAKKPRVVPTCTWTYTKDGKTLSASATFRFARSEAEAQSAFDEEKLKYQTKPLLMPGASAFWSAKLGNFQLLKGRTWLVVSVGGAKPVDRDAEASRKAAELLAPKL